MLEHRFKTLGCIGVEFKTDARNERSWAGARRAAGSV
jgi:hypothetical protein